MDTTNFSSKPPEDPQEFNLYAREEYMSHPLRRVEEKMDEDFLFYLTYIPVTYQNIKDEEEKLLCQDWLRRLTSRRPETAAGKRNRNIYLVNLILNMGDGKLLPPFTSPPPHEQLKPARGYFGTIEPPQPCPDDMNLLIEDFSHISRDGRTFFAARALPKGKGAFGYIGVSMGGTDTVWLNAAGDQIPPETLNELRDSSTSEKKENKKFLEIILANRTPSAERAELLPFYEDLLSRVKQIISTYGTDCEMYDPTIEKMIEDMQMEIVDAGNLDCATLNCYTKLNWLQALQNKLECQLQIAERRQEELNELEKSLTQDDDIVFLDISKAIKSPKIDTMFEEAARDRPAMYNVELLKKNYPECVVQKLLVLLEKEKYNLVNQERIAYQEFVLQLKTEVMSEVKRGLEKYALARKEWKRVAEVMRRVDEEKAKLLHETERLSVDADPDFYEKDGVLNEELLQARKKLQEAKERQDAVETRLGNLHDQVHQLANEYEKMIEEGKRGNNQLANQISMLQNELRKQERKLGLLRGKVKEKQEEETCRRRSRSPSS